MDLRVMTNKFSLEAENISCPLNCDWQGSKHQLLQHCSNEHPEQTVKNPAILSHNITYSNEQTYFVSAFKTVFLLHVKVCISARKIIYMLYVLQNSVKTNEYKFTVDFKTDNDLVPNKEQIMQYGNLNNQEANSVSIDISSFLSKCKDIITTITIKQFVNCPDCGKEVLEFFYRRKNKWYCKKCAPAKRACVNHSENCTYVDLSNKCQKHEWNFCQFTKYCWICDPTCGAIITNDSLSDHYVSEHEDETFTAGSTWRVEDKDSVFGRRCLITSAIGTAVCWYGLFDVKFELEVYIPMPSNRLREFQCTVKVICPNSGVSLTFTPDAAYTGPCDWYVRVERNELPWRKAELDVSVDIT